MTAAARPVIAGIGEVLWDVYPDASHCGGAPANFACHAASLGATGWIVSAVGTDALGDRALDALRARGVHCGTVARDPAHPTGTVSVTLDETGQATYAFAADPAWDHLAWSDELAALAASCDAVCFGTLCQRSTLSRDTIRRFVTATPATALRLFDVNLRQRFYDSAILETGLEMASVVKLNEEELPVVAEACGIPAAGALEVLRRMVDRYELRLAVLTCGPKGALLVSPNEESRFPAIPTSVVDTVGAGDAFTAAIAVDMLRGVSLDAMNQHANAVASFVCSQPGATTPLPASLTRAAR